MSIRSVSAVVLLAVSLAAVAQLPPDQKLPAPKAPAAKAPAAPTTAAPAANQPAQNADRAASYYHYAMAHMYEELVAIYGRSEYANKAIEEYKAAIAADPSSPYLNAGLAELYAKTGRIRDAVLEAQDIIKRDPNNLEAHRLLGRIYLRSLGDQPNAGEQSAEILRRAIAEYEEIVRLDPKSADDHILLGRLYRINNDLLKAENEFKTAVTLQPDSEDAVATLAYLYNEEGDPARAAEVLNKVPEGDRSGKVYSALGYTYEQGKDYKKAIEAYKKSLQLDPDNLDTQRSLAQNLMNDNQSEAALEQYKQIVEGDPHDAQSYQRIAEIYRRDGKFDMALDALRKAQAEVPDSQEIPYNIAVIYQAQGKFEEAENLLNDLLQKSEKTDNNYSAGEKNNRAIFLERLGSVYRDSGKTQMAVDTFRRMIPLGDDSATRAYQQMIDTLRDGKQYSQATTVAQEAVAKLPNDRNLKLVLAGQLADSGKLEEGLKLASSLLKGGPEDRDVYVAIATIYSRAKRWPEAEQNIAKAQQMASKPEDRDYVNFIAASFFERQHKYDEAEQMFKRVLADDPNNAAVLNYLGYMLADRGMRLEEALTYVKKATSLDPQNYAYLDSLGWTYYKMGNYDLAEANLRKALERTGNDPTVLEHMGDLYQKTDRLKMAVAYWERSLQEFNRSLSGDIDSRDVADVQHKLESAKVKLAQQSGTKKADAAKPQP